ncbi:MAG: hypothetical protein GTN89_00405 [Acidobacteria bacterium]|nr:hypothetical protein [Acidobacteriota bacterium]NIM60182.1 hypothetical protein [Acidobacteriota bacterium]NIO57851.1 hypothetical protein [Acidobacteriota bacterium]NIQ28860.1 hypothetical protein [Acidobacteriota bacterium]NIQ83318.1 hypothetical protein [Acidobacteriota bacterium]
MSLLARLDLEELTPAALWSALDDATREAALRSVYGDGPGGGKVEADVAIAKALRFRPNAVKQLPLERRVGYLMKNVHVDDSLATTFLLALHLNDRSEMLQTFLDDLEIPQQDGLIDESYDLQPPEPQALARASSTIYEKFGSERSDLYLAALIAMDAVTWGALGQILAARK